MKSSNLFVLFLLPVLISGVQATNKNKRRDKRMRYAKLKMRKIANNKAKVAMIEEMRLRDAVKHSVRFDDRRIYATFLTKKGWKAEGEVYLLDFSNKSSLPNFLTKDDIEFFEKSFGDCRDKRFGYCHDGFCSDIQGKVYAIFIRNINSINKMNVAQLGKFWKSCNNRNIVGKFKALS